MTSLPAVEFAVLSRFGAGDEGLVVDARAGGERQLARVAIDLREGDALGNLEGDARAAGERGLHEVGPDGERRLRAGERDRLVVVEADPDHREQLRCEADK